MSIIHEALKKTQEGRRDSSAESSPLKDAQSLEVCETQAHLHQAPETPIRRSEKIETALAADSSIFWRALGVTSLLGLFLVGMVGASSILHFKTNLKDLPFFSKKSAEPQFAKNEVKPIVAAPVNLVLSGVMSDGSHRVAVINDQTYKVGDQIEDKKITAISNDRVTLQNNQNVFELRARV